MHLIGVCLEVGEGVCIADTAGVKAGAGTWHCEQQQVCGIRPWCRASQLIGVGHEINVVGQKYFLSEKLWNKTRELNSIEFTAYG